MYEDRNNSSGTIRIKQINNPESVCPTVLNDREAIIKTRYYVQVGVRILNPRDHLDAVSKTRSLGLIFGCVHD